MIRTFIQVTPITLMVISSIFLIKGTLMLTPKDIGKLSSTFVGYNKSLASTYSHQKSDTTFGVALILIASTLQLINLLWPIRWVDLDINKLSVFLAVIFSIGVFYIALNCSNTLALKIQKDVADQLTTDVNKVQ